MGNSSLNLQEFPLSKQHWKQTANPKVLFEPVTDTLASYVINNQLTSESFAVYQMRRKNREFLVDILAILDSENSKEQKQNIFTCTPTREFRILTQWVPFRLPDLGSITLQTGIYILRQVLIGSKILYKHFGTFQINQQLIGFTSKGNCKIWLNSDYTSDSKQNYIFESTIENPEDPLSTHQNEKEEQKIVEKIFDIVENRMLIQMTKTEKKMYFEKKKQILGGDISENNDEEFQYNYSFNTGLMFINVICDLLKFDYKSYRVQLPDNYEPTDFKSARKNYLEHQNSNYQSKLSLKPYASSIQRKTSENSRKKKKKMQQKRNGFNTNLKQMREKINLTRIESPIKLTSTATTCSILDTPKRSTMRSSKNLTDEKKQIHKKRKQGVIYPQGSIREQQSLSHLRKSQRKYRVPSSAFLFENN